MPKTWYLSAECQYIMYWFNAIICYGAVSRSWPVGEDFLAVCNNSHMILRRDLKILGWNFIFSKLSRGRLHPSARAGASPDMLSSVHIAWYKGRLGVRVYYVLHDVMMCSNAQWCIDDVLHVATSYFCHKIYTIFVASAWLSYIFWIQETSIFHAPLEFWRCHTSALNDFYDFRLDAAAVRDGLAKAQQDMSSAGSEKAKAEAQIAVECYEALQKAMS